MVRNFRRRAQGKLSPRWGPPRFFILDRPNPEQPMYIIRPEAKEGPTRAIHRNNLRLCSIDPTNAALPANVENPAQHRPSGFLIDVPRPMTSTPALTPMAWNMVPAKSEIIPSVPNGVIAQNPACLAEPEPPWNQSDPNSFFASRGPKTQF